MYALKRNTDSKVIVLADWRRRWRTEPLAQEAAAMAESIFLLNSISPGWVPQEYIDAIRSLQRVTPDAVRAYASLLEEIDGEGEGA
jgi:hypothetical protein